MKSRRDRFLAFLALGLVFFLPCGCDKRDEQGLINPSSFETDPSEAVVRALIRRADEKIASSEKVRPHAIVAGPRLQGTSRSFADRFADLNRPFLLADDLGWHPHSKATINPETAESVVVIQIKRIQAEPDGASLITAAWNFEKKLEEIVFRAAADGELEVINLVKTSGI